MATYSALSVVGGGRAAELLAGALESLDPPPAATAAIKIEDGSGQWEVGGYFPNSPDPIALELLAKAFGGSSFVVSEIPDTGWVAKVRRDLKPVQAGGFWIHGVHSRRAIPADAAALEIEASMAFGTGHHPTTAACMAVLQDIADSGRRIDSVADIGCGTGILAMAAARTWDAAVVATDSDPVAVDVAMANIECNSLSDRVVCAVAEGFDHDAHRRAGPYDLVFANIVLRPLLSLAGEFRRFVTDGGTAVLSGLMECQSRKAVEAYARAGFEVAGTRNDGEWATLSLVRRFG